MILIYNDLGNSLFDGPVAYSGVGSRFEDSLENDSTQQQQQQFRDLYNGKSNQTNVPSNNLNQNDTYQNSV
jgi:hypothetical protein